MASVFSQFSIKMNFECYSAYLQAGQVNNKGAVTSLYSSSWIFNIFNWSIKVINSGNLDHRDNRFRVVMKDVLKYNVQEF